MTEYSCYVEAALTLDIHKERVGRLDQALELVPPLLELGRRVQKINIIREHHLDLQVVARTRISGLEGWRPKTLDRASTGGGSREQANKTLDAYKREAVRRFRAPT